MVAFGLNKESGVENIVLELDDGYRVDLRLERYGMFELTKKGIER